MGESDDLPGVQKSSDKVESDAKMNVCDLPMDKGLGFALHAKFYYDTNSKQCEAFIYGGAGGNGNRFNSMAECQQECGSSSDGTDYKSLIGLWRLTYVAYIYPDIQSARTRDFTVNITSIDEVNKVFEGFLID